VWAILRRYVWAPYRIRSKTRPEDALIQALMQKLPPSGPWSADERVNWLKLLTMAFQIAYGPSDEIEIKKQA